ncbi:MAG: hypothetical protein V7K26_25670 [Nostoc sp.]
MADDKTPPSEMIRVPTALIPVVRELSRLHLQDQLGQKKSDTTKGY